MSPTKKKRNRKAFWKNIKFKYRLTITNENTLEDIVTLHVSKLNGLSVLLSMLIILFVIASLIMVFTPLRNYLPGYMNSEIRTQVVRNALKADSLQHLLERQNLYVMNIQDIFRGDIKTDTIQSIDSLTTLREDSLMNRTQREEDFRRQYEETEKYNLTTIATHPEVGSMSFYPPLRGMIAHPFNATEGHYGTSITALPNQNVLATLDGTVTLSCYTAEDGYVLQIQHNQDLVSNYKHCGFLLKKQGDAVKAGEVIAVMPTAHADADDLTLTFELWHRGKALNPETYIVF